MTRAVTDPEADPLASTDATTTHVYHDKAESVFLSAPGDTNVSWLPALVLLGSGLSPVGYYLSSSDRNEAGRAGVTSAVVPVIGLVSGVILFVANLGSLVANPVRLVVSLGAVLSVLLVIGQLIPRRIGATIVESILG
jgi:hypothetical protein